jgi:hypothetical protein
MPNVWEGTILYDHYKVSTVSGDSLSVTGVTTIASGNIVVDSGSISISGTTVTGGRLETEPLGIPITPRVITVSTGNTNTALTSGVNRISMRAAGTNTFYSVGSGSQTATLSGHFIANGERLDIGVPSGSPNIAVICASGSSGVLYVSELG